MKLPLSKTTLSPAHTALPNDGPELKVDKNNQLYYPAWELREQLIARLKRIITQELQSTVASREERARIISDVFADLANPVKTQSQLPDRAPALYKERANKSQSAEEFTHIHYSEYFGKGLTRAALKRLDKSLYGMLMKGGFPESLKDAIPPAQGKGGGGKGKARLSDKEAIERKRARDREASRRYYERKKSPSV